MNRKGTVFAISAAVMAFGSTPVSAQFGDLMNKVAGSESEAGVSQRDVEAQQEQLIGRFMDAQNELSTAQHLMLSALGSKEAAAAAEAEAADLKGKSMSKKLIKEKIQSTEDNQKKINELAKDNAELSVEGKKLFAQSLIPYAASVANTAGMVQAAMGLADGIQAQLKAAGMMGAMKVKKSFDIGLYLAPKIPGLSGGQIKQLGSMVSFARKNGVEIDDSVAASAKL